MKDRIFDIVGGGIGAAVGAGVGYVIESQPPHGDVLIEISKGIMVLGTVVLGTFMGYDLAGLHRITSRINEEVKKRRNKITGR